MSVCILHCILFVKYKSFIITTKELWIHSVLQKAALEETNNEVTSRERKKKLFRKIEIKETKLKEKTETFLLEFFPSPKHLK